MLQSMVFYMLQLVSLLMRNYPVDSAVLSGSKGEMAQAVDKDGLWSFTCKMTENNLQNMCEINFVFHKYVLRRNEAIVSAPFSCFIWRNSVTGS